MRTWWFSEGPGLPARRCRTWPRSVGGGRVVCSALWSSADGLCGFVGGKSL